MKYLRVIVENKKLAYYLVALVALGIFALILRRNIPLPEITNLAESQPEVYVNYQTTHALTAFEIERALEARLEEFFALVEGAGRVRVMISPLAGRETIFAVDVNQSNSFSQEEDSQGGKRETRQYQSQENTVIITDRQGVDRPLVLREIEPKIQGIVIIAEGGESPFVRDALTRAARAVLGLEAHNIQVLTGSF